MIDLFAFDIVFVFVNLFSRKYAGKHHEHKLSDIKNSCANSQSSIVLRNA